MAINLPVVASAFVDPKTGQINREWFLALRALTTTVTGAMVTAVNISGGNGITVAGSPITTAGTITLGIGNLTCANAQVAGTVTSSRVVVTGTITAANVIATGTVTAADVATSGTIRPAAAGGIVGTIAGGNANAGSVGEFQVAQISSAAAVGLTSGTALTVTGLALTAGDWDVWGMARFIPSAPTTVTSIAVGISSTNNALPGGDGPQTALVTTFATGQNQQIDAPASRVNIAAATNYYVVALAAFGVSSALVSGAIYARRRR